MPSSETLVTVSRGDLIECLHRGHIVVVDHKGDLLYSLGNPHYVTYARSTAKPIQAIAVVESGAAHQFTSVEIALMCASHNGELEHVQTVLDLLFKIGLTPTQLQCGVHDPFYKPASDLLKRQQILPSTLHNNCSGKHVGMLALANYWNHPLTHYTSLAHPVQQRMLTIFAEMACLEKNQIIIGTDGCGVPVYGLHLRNLALAYARIGSPEELSNTRAEACRKIISAITENAYHLAGTDRFDTRLIQVTQGKLIGKMGAEGVYAISVPSLGWGIAIKVDDGAERALYPTAMETLTQLGLLNHDQQLELANFHHPNVKNWEMTQVGHITPIFNLKSNQLDIKS